MYRHLYLYLLYLYIYTIKHKSYFFYIQYLSKHSSPVKKKCIHFARGEFWALIENKTFRGQSLSPLSSSFLLIITLTGI